MSQAEQEETASRFATRKPRSFSWKTFFDGHLTDAFELVRTCFQSDYRIRFAKVRKHMRQRSVRALDAFS